jgi:branched-chain amino acid transport system ATP-binding protein
MTALLVIDALRCGYGQATVLSGVSVTVHTGEIVAILGRNGAGKTTLINTVMGLIPGQGGSIRLDGRETAGYATWRVARLGVAIVPQGRRVFAPLTVAEHLAIAHRRPSRRARLSAHPLAAGPLPAASPTAFGRPPESLRPRSAQHLAHPRHTHPPAPAHDEEPVAPAAWTPATVLELLPALRHRLRHRGSQLSGGEQQMLALARALLANPRLLLLDEPTEGLAPLVAREIAEAIRRLADGGTTILIAEQNLGVVRAVADRSVALHSGTLTADLDHEHLHDADLLSRLLGVQ